MLPLSILIKHFEESETWPRNNECSFVNTTFYKVLIIQDVFLKKVVLPEQETTAEYDKFSRHRRSSVTFERKNDQVDKSYHESSQVLKVSKQSVHAHVPEPSFVSQLSRDAELETVPQLNNLFETNLEPDVSHKILVQTGPQL